MLSLGQPVLGFINPFLYNEGQAGINDISTGSNDGCNWNNTGQGFPAVLGWDAVRLFQTLFSTLGLTTGSIGHGSRDARLWFTADHT